MSIKFLCIVLMMGVFTLPLAGGAVMGQYGFTDGMSDDGFRFCKFVCEHTKKPLKKTDPCERICTYIKNFDCIYWPNGVTPEGCTPYSW